MAEKNALSQSESKLATAVNAFADNFLGLEKELRTVLVGMSDVLRFTLAGLFAGGHILLEGAPGLGKTLLVRSLADALGLSFSRIQFTSDLMPSDITGTQILSESEQGKKSFVLKQGPVFANVVLADEINRAGPKTQSALLEAMEEQQVSLFGETLKLPQPFFVLATQNPVELEGTYPLPEAQLDRFLFKLLVPAPSSSELKEILNRTTGEVNDKLAPNLSSDDTIQMVSSMRLLVRQVAVSPVVLDVLVSMLQALTPSAESATNRVREYVRYGPGPRGAQAILLGAKVLALLDKRINVSYEDIKAVLTPALRHRMILNFQAEADGVSADEIIEEVKDAS